MANNHIVRSISKSIAVGIAKHFEKVALLAILFRLIIGIGIAILFEIIFNNTAFTYACSSKAKRIEWFVIMTILVV